MKPLLFFGLFCFALTGCESMSKRVHDRFAGPTPKSRNFAADERATFAAARAALDDMGYRFMRGGPAQRELEALSGLQSGGDVAMNSMRQFQLTAKFSSAGGEGTRVDVVVRELFESDSERQPGLATSTPLRDSALYEQFFHGIERHLSRTGAE
ncbi:MAG: hypothetical protein KGJ37_00205 [Verrucomicrobiota bacterium]|nr:hypothetical protein [Verrucomicrobiota bacterium]